MPTPPPLYPTGVYPPPAPTVTGTAITVDAFLRDPLRVQRTIQDLTAQRFIADRVFSPGGPATGGAVIFDQVQINDLYAGRDVQAIKPGSEFPIVTDANPAPLVAKTIKWGGAAIITYEERDRDRRDILNRELTKLRNTIVRKVDTVAVATLRGAPILQQTASSSWTNAAAAIVKDVATAEVAVDKQDMGYQLTDALVSPTTMLNITSNDKILQQIYYSGGAVSSPLGSGASGQSRMSGFLGLNWYVSNRVDDDEVILLAGQTAGSISDEKPLYSRVVDQPEQERLLVMAARLTVPYVTDPKSVVRITGVK